MFRSRVFLIKHMSKFLPPATTSILYKVYVRSTLEYAVPIWMFGLTAHEADTLEKLQASACRAYLSAKFNAYPDWMTPKESLFEQAGWESPAWRRHILGLTFFHHVFYCFPSLLEKFNFKVTKHSRRFHFIVLPHVGKHMSKYFLFKYAIAWNKLPPTLRSLANKVKFKKKIKVEFDDFKCNLAGISHLFD